MSKWIEVQMGSKYMKKHSPSLARKEMQIKMTLKFHVTHSRWQSSRMQMPWGSQGERNPHTPRVGMQASVATMEWGMEVPQKTKNRPSVGSCCTGCTQRSVSQHTTETPAHPWLQQRRSKQPRCPSTDERIKKIWSTHNRVPLSHK
jgi:hypothetical protein